MRGLQLFAQDHLATLARLDYEALAGGTGLWGESHGPRVDPSRSPTFDRPGRTIADMTEGELLCPMQPDSGGLPTLETAQADQDLMGLWVGMTPVQRREIRRGRTEA